MLNLFKTFVLLKCQNEIRHRKENTVKNNNTVYFVYNREQGKPYRDLAGGTECIA